MICGERCCRAVGSGKNGFLLLLSGLLILATPLTSWSQGLTPDSPRVKAMAKRGIEYFKKHRGQGKDHMGSIGGKALRGLAIAKYYDVYKLPGGKTDPHVVEALTACRAATKSDEGMLGPGAADYGHHNYEASIALIFLCEVDPKGSKAEIAKFAEFLLNRQMGNGAWSYNQYMSSNFGDVSQTQYVILALWTAKQVGIYVPDDTIIKGCNWLLKTQEGAGSWGYHPLDNGSRAQPYRGSDPESRGAKAAENSLTNHNVAPSLAAAGLSSLYISAGLLQFVNAKPVKEAVKKESVSSILKVKDDTEELKPLTNLVNKNQLLAGLQRGDSWFASRSLSAKCGCKSGRDACGGREHFPFYYLYVYERYCTFRDLARGLNEPSPSWYQQGVQQLANSQKKDGGWESRGKHGPKHGRAVATSFAIFFLIRSTQKSVSKLAQSTDFQGGRGLPQDTTAARFQGSKVLGSPIGGDIDSLLGLLADVDNPKFDNMVALPPELVLSKNQKQRNSQVAKLETVIRSGSYEARRIAVQNLARAQGMDAVPILIFALSDPDETVMKAARDALRFVSRKINGFGLPDKATDPDRARAQQKWRNWYRSVRPDVKLD